MGSPREWGAGRQSGALPFIPKLHAAWCGVFHVRYVFHERHGPGARPHNCAQRATRKIRHGVGCSRSGGLHVRSQAEDWNPFPRLIRGYTAETARHDAVAGVTVALFAIPQGMAYALIAGFPPMAGVHTAIAASIAAAIFGSSEFLVDGPTNAIAVMLGANAALFAAQGDPTQAVILLTFMIGVMQLVAAALRVGAFTRFVSEPVLSGFTAGAGLYILINQLPALCGVEKAELPADILGWVPPRAAAFDLVRWVGALTHARPHTLMLGLGTLGIVRGLQHIEPRLGRRLPAPFLAILAVTLVCHAMQWGEPEAAATKVKLVRDIQTITRELPDLALPRFDLASARQMVEPMFAIGLLGAVEAIAIGKALAARAGQTFSANRQLVGEGAANLAASLVGGFASSGSFSRTAVNYEAGARTRFSAIAAGVLVLAIVFTLAPLANDIPIAALAGTLVHIGLKLVDVSRIRSIFRATKVDRTVLLVTFVAVLVTEELQSALFLGIGLSIFLALRRAEGFKLTVLHEGENGRLVEAPHLTVDDVGAVVTLNLQGELFFAAAEVLERQLDDVLHDGRRILVLRMAEAYNMDVTTAVSLGQVAERARAKGGRLILSGVRPGMHGTLERAGVVRRLGEEAIFVNEPELLASTLKALEFARSLTRGRAAG